MSYGEPWRVASDDSVRDAIGRFVMGSIPCITEDAVDYIAPNEENTERIIACVNACEGIPSERLTQISLAHAIDSLDSGYENIDCSYCCVSAALREQPQETE